MEIASKTVSVVVTSAMSAAAVGSGDMDVLSTPMMIALMERAAMELLKEQITPDLSSVGIAIDVEHTKATAVGVEVSATAQLVEQQGRIAKFTLSAFDASGNEIGKGSHTRAVVSRERFLSKL